MENAGVRRRGSSGRSHQKRHPNRHFDSSQYLREPEVSGRESSPGRRIRVLPRGAGYVVARTDPFAEVRKTCRADVLELAKECRDQVRPGMGALTAMTLVRPSETGFLGLDLCRPG